MKQKIYLFGLGWVLIVLLAGVWQSLYIRYYEQNSIRDVGRAFFRQVLVTREWNAHHGGVYVFADAQTPPNLYLPEKKVERNITLPDGRMLTLVNPAYMTRQIAEIAKESEGVQFHITSLKPIRPQNAPNAWESEALKAFQNGMQEHGEFSDDGLYLYMAPLQTQKSCLKCHGDQEYAVGDVRGGISVTIPFVRSSTLPVTIGYLFVALFGLVLILLLGKRLLEAYDRLERQSTTDELTQIYNRRFFMQRLEEEFRRSTREHQPLSLIMADIDYFKSFNDTYGHLEGDRALKAVAVTMQDALKRPGDLLARYGGEEFIIMLPNTPLENALHFARELREAVEALKIETTESKCCGVVTVSFGVVESIREVGSYEALIRRADEALYRAKQLGRNRVETFEQR